MKEYCYHCHMEFTIKGSVISFDHFSRVPYKINTDGMYSLFIDTMRNIFIDTLNSKKDFIGKVISSDISGYKVKSLTFLHEVES